MSLKNCFLIERLRGRLLKCIVVVVVGEVDIEVFVALPTVVSTLFIS